MLEWSEPLIQYEWCPYKKRETEAGTPGERNGYEDREKVGFNDGGRDCMMLSQTKEHLGQPEVGRDKKGSPLESSEGTWPC